MTLSSARSLAMSARARAEPLRIADRCEEILAAPRANAFISSKANAVWPNHKRLTVTNLMPACSIAALTRWYEIIRRIVSPVLVNVIGGQHRPAGPCPDSHDPADLLAAPVARMPAWADFVVKHYPCLGRIAVFASKRVGRLVDYPSCVDLRLSYCHGS